MPGLASELKELEYGKGMSSSLTELANTILRIKQAQYNRAVSEQFVSQMAQQLQRAREQGLPEGRVAEISSALDVFQRQMESPAATSPLSLIPGGAGAPDPTEAMGKISNALISATITQKLLDGIYKGLQSLEGAVDDKGIQQAIGKYKNVVGISAFQAMLANALKMFDTYRTLGLEPPQDIIDKLTTILRDVYGHATEIAKTQITGQYHVAAAGEAARFAMKQQEDERKWILDEIKRKEAMIEDLKKRWVEMTKPSTTESYTGTKGEKDPNKMERDFAPTKAALVAEIAALTMDIGALSERIGGTWTRQNAAQSVNEMIDADLNRYIAKYGENPTDPRINSAVSQLKKLREDIQGQLLAPPSSYIPGGGNTSISGSWRSSYTLPEGSTLPQGTPTPGTETPGTETPATQPVPQPTPRAPAGGTQPPARLNLYQEVMKSLEESKRKK